MGKRNTPVERPKGQKSISDWIVKRPRESMEPTSTPGDTPTVNPQVITPSSSSEVHVGVSPSRAAGNLSFGATPTVAPRAPTVVSSSGTVPTGTPSASGDTSVMPQRLSWPTSSTREVANFTIDLVSSDEEEEEVGVTPIDGRNCRPTSAMAPVTSSSESCTLVPTPTFLPPTMSSSSSSASLLVSAGSTFTGDTPAVAPPLSLATSSYANNANFVITLESSEDEEEVEIPPSDAALIPRISPTLQVIRDIGKMTRISENRNVEVQELSRILRNSGSCLDPNKWFCKDYPATYTYLEGSRYRSGESLFRQRMTANNNNAPIVNREDIFSKEDMTYITEHPCLHILWVISQEKKPFSEDRREELEIIGGMLRISSSNLDPTKLFWRYSRSEWKSTYMFWEEGNGKFRTMTSKLRTRLTSNKNGMKEHLIANGKWEQVKQRRIDLDHRNRRYFMYMPVGVSAIDINDLLEDDPSTKQFFTENSDIQKFTYVGLCTHIKMYDPDIRTGHYSDEDSPLFKFVQNGGRLYSGAVEQFHTREEAAKNETYWQVAAFANQDAGFPITVLNKKYGTIIPSSKILEAIESGQRSPILRFGDSPIDDNPPELNFKAGCDELTQKFKKLQNVPATSSMPPTNPANPKDEKSFSVYIAIAIEKQEVGKSTAKQLMWKLLGGTPMKIGYYIGKSCTEDLRNGIRRGHFSDPDSQLYQAAEKGHQIYLVHTISNLSEKEAFDLESFYIFNIGAVAENDPNVKILNREYGMIIPTELVKKAVTLGMGETPFVSFAATTVIPDDKTNLPLYVSQIVDITTSFVFAK